MDRDERLLKLEELTEGLPKVPGKMGPEVRWADPSGDSYGWSLMWEPDCAIVKAYVPQGVIVTRHHHDQREFLIVYKGAGVLHREDIGDLLVQVGQVVLIQSGIVHSFEATEDCWMTGITIPASKGYPGVGPAGAERMV